MTAAADRKRKRNDGRRPGKDGNMKENSARHFSNRSCQYFPCHKVEDAEDFNCLCCYCPLYALGERCGGNFRYNGKGIKDCSGCDVPHREGGYEHVMAHIRDITDQVRRKEV